MKQTPKPLFDGIKVHEGLILHHLPTNKKVFLTHGHQGDLLNDEWWWVGRFVVRNIWKVFQLVGARDPTSPAKNFKKRVKLEKEIVEWVNGNLGKVGLLILVTPIDPTSPEKRSRLIVIREAAFIRVASRESRLKMERSG